MVFAAESRLSGQLSGFRPLFQPGLIRRYTSKCMLDRRPAEIRRHLRKTKVKIKPGSIFLRRVYHMLCSIKTLFCLRDLPQFFPYLHIDLCQVTDCLTIGFHCGSRFTLLKKAYIRSLEKPEEAFEVFKKENSEWVGEYGLYMAVKKHFNSVSWNQWDEDIRNREEKAMEHYRELCREEIDFYAWLQYEFYTQWGALKDYANKNGIQIIGDIPIYVAFDSADTWAAPEMFQFDEKNEPKAVAGCPPDGFSATGQLWGNPLYDWEYHKKTGYQWWIRRIEYCFKLYDIVRIDHFRGFDEYYSIPYGDETAEFGHWEKGPGIDLFNALKEALGEVPVIAEDLGFLTPTVLQLVKDTGYPGMKVLEFAFDSREESDYLPHTYPRNCVVYTGTHDNETVSGWYKELNDQDRKFADDYLNLYGRKEEEIPMEFVRAALSSVADTAIIPVQDYLGLGKEARINTPSTLGNNWKWRMLEGEITPELTARIRRMTKLYGRLA